MALNRGKISFEELQKARQSGMLVDLRYAKEEEKNEPVKKKKKALPFKNHIKFSCQFHRISFLIKFKLTYYF